MGAIQSLADTVNISKKVSSIIFAPIRGWKLPSTTDGFSLKSPDILSKVGVTFDYGLKQDPNFYQVDGVISENYTSTVKLTNNPVETGVIISDHSYREPYVITIDGIITNSPTILQSTNRIPGSYQYTGGGLKGAALKAANSVTDIFTGNRIKDAWVGLVDLQNKRELVTLYTALATYKNMVLTSVTTVNDQKNQLRVKMTFTEAIVVGETDSLISQNKLAPAVVGIDLSKVLNVVNQWFPIPLSI